MAGERKSESQQSGKLGAERAGPEQPDRHIRVLARHGADLLPW